MNKQCHKCEKPVPDGEYKTIGTFITCDVCAPLVSRAELVRSIIGVSYAHDEQMKAVRIVEELEAENKRLQNLVNSILIAMVASHDSDIVSLATTLQAFYEKHSSLSFS